MKLPRPSRLIAVCVMLFSMAFMQLAVAAYACPGLSSTAQMQQGDDMIADTGMQDVDMTMNGVDMSGCTGDDLAQPNLCHAHDHADHQSLDKPNVPAVSSFIPTTLVLTLVTDNSPEPSRLSEAPSQKLTRTTAPPLSIQHCCFRI
jgi:hypothetical protein